MLAHRIRAPREDGAVLAQPALDSAAQLAASNADRFADWNYDFQGRQFQVLREKARADAFEAARAYHERLGLPMPADASPSMPVIATGHQPELYHPGVWVKNFAVAGIAQKTGGVGLNLVVDNDIPKAAAIRVPHAVGENLRTQAVSFDDWISEAPFEDQHVNDPARFAAFPGEVRRVLDGLVAAPLLKRFWPHVMNAPSSVTRVGERFARGRRLIEEEWGVRNWDVPLSTICETDAFLWFASHLLAQLPRFQAVHNQALKEYRTLYHIRSKNHPVADLGREGEWLEAPFWAWRKEEPRRRPLLARQLAKTMELRIAGERTPFAELPLASDREACCAVEALRELPEKGIRLRTRALTTTMFARFFLSDLFIHGIGGAKYDELGDEIAKRFFHINPPEFLTLSMTLHLGLPTSDSTVGDLHRAERKIRDLTWQPEQFLAAEGSNAEAIAEKQRLIAWEPATKAERKARYKAFRATNEGLAAKLADQLPQAVADRADIVDRLRRDGIARSREYSFVLFDESRIKDAMSRILTTV